MRGLKTLLPLSAVALGGALVALAVSREVGAHCDTMDGPVVAAGRTALERADVTPALMWVAKDREGEVKAAFVKALAARRASPEAREVADTWFFESLVRLHRTGEGETYTGIRPAGTPLEPGIAEAEAALQAGVVDELAKDLAAAVADGARTRFARVLETRKKADRSVEAGREYVAAYVEFLHYVERMHEAVAGPARHHEGAR